MNNNEKPLAYFFHRYPYIIISSLILILLSLIEWTKSSGSLYEDKGVNWWFVLLIINFFGYFFRKPLLGMLGFDNSDWAGKVKEAVVLSRLHQEEKRDDIVIPLIPPFKITENENYLIVEIDGFKDKIEKDYEKAIPIFENTLDMDVLEWEFKRGRCKIVFSKKELEVNEYYCSENPEEYLVLGIDPQYGEVRWEFNKHPHMLLVGAPGSGKSVMFKNVITQMGKDWELFFCDPKQVEFAELAYLGYNVAFSQDEIKKTLEEVERIMEERYTYLRENRVAKYTDLPEEKRFKPCFLVIDEFAAFYSLLEDNKAVTKYSGILRRLVQKGRAAGVQCILMTQKASSKVMDSDTRDTIACSVAMGMNRPEAYVMAFGEEGRQLKPLGIGQGYYNIGYGIRKMKTYNLSHSEFVERISSKFSSNV